MSLTREAEQQARAVARHPVLEHLTRAGFLGYGLTHLLLAWVALQIALQKPTTDVDQSGALRVLASAGAGRILVLLIAFGFAAMTVWQVLSAAVGHLEFSGGRRVFERVASAGRAILYAYLGWTAWKVFKGASAGGDQQQQSVSDLLTRPNGQTIVLLAGFALAIFGIALVIYGFQKQFMHHLRTGKMSADLKRTMRWLGIAGYVAKGVAYGVAGALLMVAARSFDPAKARGLDAALRTLAAQPYGRLLLAVIAAGLAAFGVFCLLQSRYRKVT
ncbi:hypothetical protein Rhe02_36810 [Rhizocola hellebori]|uniref:DUF1206 domain-containing protein n=1 Tax=Rhizocola hellebori TaxID=1392758 RepID=A0A8J3Q8X7_9ACTN|nr:DUF1206 domain-containing protein [Rhizocola hellebori]GIH05614.1 hypothetical protein Rhe02_36810 [Rhizocola hellebori]